MAREKRTSPDLKDDGPDGCGSGCNDAERTPDAELPPARGGVAPAGSQADNEEGGR